MKKQKKLISQAVSATEARTIVYIHGIGNKPQAAILKCQWDRALMGFDLGERSRLAYWVSREFYPEPSGEECRDGDISPRTDRDQDGLHVKARLEQDNLGELVDSLAVNQSSRRLLNQLARKLDRPDATLKTASSMNAKLLPLPAFLRRWITRCVTKAFLKDVNDFFFIPERREVMRRSLLQRLTVGGGPFVVIAHSQGSLIAYDVLSSLAPGIDVRLFVTIGSPLGITEVKDQLKVLGKRKTLTVPACVQRWLNISDRRDVVALDHGLKGDFAKSSTGVQVEDIPHYENPDGPSHPHSARGYLQSHDLRVAVNDAVDSAMFQPVADFLIARDLSRRLEGGPPEQRHPLLLELSEINAQAGMNMDQLRAKVRSAIRECAPGADGDELRLDEMKRYIAVHLTRTETERLAAKLHLAEKTDRAIHHVWLNARKYALLDQSLHTIQAAPAHSAYAALGKDITWAVLDSGVNGRHGHFSADAIGGQFDATRRGAVQVLATDAQSDGNGHGTHVCGIITGSARVKNRQGRELALSGVAPQAQVISYRVLANDGAGEDSWIIKALDHIADTNEQAGRLVIHGVNLSLGGPFDQSSFGCGHTPLCMELRRLWNQGVLVVLAAGNEGFVRLVSDEGEIDANMDLTIGDPANLEEAIAVGSVHKAKPHLYGISYFSSRGPTADGRQKPDVVAPGERILSCRHKPIGKAQKLEELYLEMSGTSMAAPHVSGLLAAFLSARREFIGYPDKVKKILYENCTDLGRDRAHQGYGLPNLVRMLVAT